MKKDYFRIFMYETMTLEVPGLRIRETCHDWLAYTFQYIRRKRRS